MTPDVPAVVPIVSDEPSVTATLPAFIARVPMLFPLAVRVKVPFEPESSRLVTVIVPLACIKAPLCERLSSPLVEEIDSCRSVSPEALNASVPVPLFVIELPRSLMAIFELELPDRARFPVDAVTVVAVARKNP